MPADRNLSTEKSERELVVMLAPNDKMSLMTSRVNPELFAPFGLVLRPIFDRRKLAGPQAEQLEAERSRYFTINAEDAALDEIANALRGRSEIAAAYVKPKGSIPHGSVPPAASPSAMNDLTSLQIYLGPAPAGVGAMAAWNTSGANGSGMQVTDVEQNWNFNHEDLQTNKRSVLTGTPSGGKDHGTAVIGIIGGDQNAFGITGIAFAASIGAAAITTGITVATTIDDAAATLTKGDVLLIEWEVPGPRGNSIPIEWWRPEFVAIRSAVINGVIVVSAAGNGGDDLGHPDYDIPALGFPPEWKNPFRRGEDSGSILVGAGAPPPGTNGRNHGPDRSRLPESNYGDCVDAQGWGREVATTGFGDIHRGSSTNQDQFYTRAFPQTSAAAAIVAGVIVSAQGARKKAGKQVWDSFVARAALRDPANGSPQPNEPQRIGPRPDLAKLLALT